MSFTPQSELSPPSTRSPASVPPPPSEARWEGQWRTTLALGGLTFVGLLAVNAWILNDFPNSADEYAYVWQAQALSHFTLTGPIPEPRDTFAFFHLGDLAGERFSRFPQGWPLLLTLGVWSGWPGWVNPLLSSLTMMGLHRLGMGAVGARAALLGCGLVMLSPFFMLNGASYHSHPASLAVLVGLLLALERGGVAGRARAAASSTSAGHADSARPTGFRTGVFWLASGFLFGFGILIRPLTGVLLGGAASLYAFGRLLQAHGLGSRGLASHGQEPHTRAGDTRELRMSVLTSMLSFGLGGLPCALWLLWSNARITGSPWLLPTRYLDPEEGLGFGVHGHTLQQGLQNTLVWAIEGLAYSFFMTPLLLLLARGRAGARERLWWTLLLLPVLGYLFYWNPGGNRYGPRFWYEGLAPFALLVGVGMVRALELPRYRLLAGVFGLIGLAGAGKLLGDAHHQIEQRTAVFRAISQANAGRGLPGKSIVLLLGSSGSMPVFDLTRNPPDFAQAPVLLGRARGEADREVAAHWPDRTLYYYRWDETGGKLSPVDLAHPETPDPLPDL